MINYIKEKINQWSEQGFRVPLVYDPKKKAGSFTATLVVMSFALWVLSLFAPTPYLTEHLNGMDSTDALMGFGVCLGAYIGRKIGIKDVSMSGAPKSKISKK